MATKVEMFSVTHESVTVPVDGDREIRTALRTNQIARFVIVPSQKENNTWDCIGAELEYHFGLLFG